MPVTISYCHLYLPLPLVVELVGGGSVIKGVTLSSLNLKTFVKPQKRGNFFSSASETTWIYNKCRPLKKLELNTFTYTSKLYRTCGCQENCIIAPKSCLLSSLNSLNMYPVLMTQSIALMRVKQLAEDDRDSPRLFFYFILSGSSQTWNLAQTSYRYTFW